jgi:hypothetical protein
MPDIEIVKLKIRRGTEAQRTSVILEQGELGYTTDNKRIWVGDGFTSGGNITGNIVHPPLSITSRTALATATTGDLVYENNFLYQLSGSDYSLLSSWGFIGSVPDTNTIDYNASNKLHVIDNAISARNLNPDSVYSAGAIGLNATEGLSANVDNSTIQINSNKLSVLTIDENHIDTSSFGNGIEGGSGTTISIDATSTFSFPSGELEIASVPAGVVDANALKGSSLGATLNVSGNVLNLATIGNGATNALDAINYDIYGRVSSRASTVVQNITGVDTAYKGYLNQYPSAPWSGGTLIAATSANSAGTTASVNLSSAGFIQFDTGTEGVVAIPVFKVPTN